jgi:peptidoglycan hydrolase CwlO-like protein
MRKRSVMVLISFIGLLFLIVYSLGNLSESQKKIDIAKFEYEQSRLEVKKAEMDLDRLVYKILEIGEKQNNSVLKPYLEQLSTAHGEL